MIRFGLFLIVAGGICGYFGYKEWDLAQGATEAPQEIRLKDLIARGSEGNPNVVITDFVALVDNFVVQTKGSDKKWTKVWIPLVPIDEVAVVPGQPLQVQPHTIKAVLFSTRLRNEGEAGQVVDQPKLQVLVTNKMMSVSGEEKKLLTESYRGADFTKVLILQEGREPAGPTKLILLGGGGGVALAAGIIMLLVGLARWSQKNQPPPPLEEQ